MGENNYQIGIIGGGLIGLGIGWQLARNGFQVIIWEKDKAGAATSRVAAGMLAPHAEVKFEEINLMKMGQESLKMYPQFIEELKTDAGWGPSIDKCGTLLVGIDRDDAAQLKRLYEFRHELNLRVEWIGGSAARDKEALLSPRVSSGIWLPDDAQINNRKLTKCLADAFRQKGGVLKEYTGVESIKKHEKKGFEVFTQENAYNCDELILAAGSWTPQIRNLSSDYHPPLGPVKGQILSLKSSNEVNLSCMVRSPRKYLLPKGGDRIIIGATSEEKGFDMHPTAGGIKDLLDDAWELVPGIYDLNLEEISVGLRPATRDHAPVIGKSNINGLYYATGHYRHGVLLTPLTSYGMLEEMKNNKPLKMLENFGPDRFNQ